MSMKNPEVLANIHHYCAMEETLIVFSNSMGLNETPCNTASHFDPCCLQMVIENNLKTRENPEISGKILRNGWPELVQPG